MSKKTVGILQLLGSIGIIILFHYFYPEVIKWLGITSKTSNIIVFFEYLLISFCIYIVYRSNLHSGRNKFSKTMLNSLIITVACFIFLIFVTIILSKGSYSLFKINISYPFSDYFKTKMTLNSALGLIINCFFKPYLLCMIFVLGISNVIRKSWSSAFISGISYAIYYGILLKTTFKVAVLSSIIPGVVFVLLTYFYKTNKNIWSTIIIYILYVLFGSLIINYII